MTKKSRLKNKWIIGFDTICDGNQCVMDDGSPALFNSREEAMKELFGDALAMILAQDEDSLTELEISQEQITKMKEIDATGDAAQMDKFLDEHPEMNYNSEFVEEADEFILNRKAFFTRDGIVITGKKLE
jgi:hypothetical protein